MTYYPDHRLNTHRSHARANLAGVVLVCGLVLLIAWLVLGVVSGAADAINGGLS